MSGMLLLAAAGGEGKFGTTTLLEGVEGKTGVADTEDDGGCGNIAFRSV